MTRTYKESDFIFAVNALRTSFYLPLNRVARIFNVLCLTLFDRYYKILLKRDTTFKSRKFTDLKKQIVIRYIFDLNSRLFFFRRSTVENIANRLFAKRNAKRVGKN
jgi:hypothetical protein